MTKLECEDEMECNSDHDDDVQSGRGIRNINFKDLIVDWIDCVVLHTGLQHNSIALNLTVWIRETIVIRDIQVATTDNCHIQDLQQINRRIWD